MVENCNIYKKREMVYKWSMESVSDDNRCFVCGEENPIGLRLKFRNSKSGAVSEVEFGKNYEGWSGIVHGGILSTVIDEVLVKSASLRGYRCVTAEIGVRYRKPCLTGIRYKLEGRIVEVKGKIIRAEGTISDENGDILVSGTGRLFVVGNL